MIFRYRVIVTKCFTPVSVDRYDLGITVPPIARISMTSGNGRMNSREVCKQEEIIAIGYSEAEEGPRRCIVSAVDGGYWRPTEAVAMHWRTSINFAPRTDRCVFRCVLNCLATVFSLVATPRTHEMRGDAAINQRIYRWSPLNANWDVPGDHGFRKTLWTLSSSIEERATMQLELAQRNRDRIDHRTRGQSQVSSR